VDRSVRVYVCERGWQTEIVCDRIREQERERERRDLS